MEENPLHDNMDDYVKKSFENYEENPSDDMWSRIARELPEPEEERRPIVLFWRNGVLLRWAAAAVFVLLLGRWGYLEFRPENKSDLAVMHENTPIPVDHNAGTTPQTQTNATNSGQPLPDKRQITEYKAQTGNLEKIKPYTTQRTPPHPSTPNTPKGSDASRATTPEAERLGVSPVPSGKPDDPTEGHSPKQHEASDTAQNTRLVEDFTKLQIIDLQEIEPKNIEISHKPSFSFLQVNSAVKPANSTANWYVGMALGPQFTLGEKVQNVRQNNGRYRFSNQAERTTVTRQAGLQIGRTLGRRFALESGLNYQHTNRYAIHRPQIEYRESRLTSSGSGTESRSFDYDLNTYGGSAAVSLNMEVRGNQIPAANERVRMSIQTREQLKMLQMPLLAVFRSGKGRFQATLKAGLTASYLLDNQLNIESFGLENPRLRPRTTGRAFTVNYDRPSDFVFGYMAAAGLEYGLNDHLRLQILPTFQSEFARKDANGGKLPTQNSLGLTAGVSWWF